MRLTNASNDWIQTMSVPSTPRRLRLMESFTANMAESTGDEDRAPFLPDAAPDPITPLLTCKVIEEETHTVKRTTTISQFAQTASPETPTQQRVSRGFSSPVTQQAQRTPVLTAPLKNEKFHATPGNKGKCSRTPSPVGTQHTPFSTPQRNFTQVNRVDTPPMPPLTQPRRMSIPWMLSSTQPHTPQTPIHEPLKYYPMPHPTELEPFMSKYFYVVTVGQDVGIFATWCTNSFSFGITANCSRDEANSCVTGVTRSSHSKCTNWQEAHQIYSKAYTEGRV